MTKKMNPNTFTQFVLAIVARQKANAAGVINGSYRLAETAKGGIIRKFGDSAVKSFFDGQRRAFNLDSPKGNLSAIDVAAMFAKTDNMDKVLTVAFTSAKTRVTLDGKVRQQRLAAFSRRIVAAFTPFVECANPADIVLSNANMLKILNAVGSLYSTATVRYVAPVKKVVVVKKANKATSKTQSKSQSNRRPSQPTV